MELFTKTLEFFIGDRVVGSFIHLSAETLSSHLENANIYHWKDMSGNRRDVAVSGGCGHPKYGKASWNKSIPVIKFAHSGTQTCLKTTSAYSVSTSGTYVAVLSWSGPGGPWHPIAAVSHDTHWSLRMVLDSLEINMHVRNEDEPRIRIELNKPYIVIGRVDDSTKTSYMWVWDVQASSWLGQQQTSTKGIPNGGVETVTIGRATILDNEFFQGEIATYAMWDRFLSDTEVKQLIDQYANNMGQGQETFKGS